MPTWFSRPFLNRFLKTAGLRCAPPTLRNARTKKEAERRQTRVSLLHLPAKRAPWPGRARLSAFHCGSRQGDSWSPRLSVRPCFPGQSGAFGPVRPLQPGSGDLARLHGRYPRRNKSQCSEHLTCRSLCRQADARRRPSAEGTNPLPASTGPAPASPSSPGWRPCTRSETKWLLFLVAGLCQDLSSIRRLRLDFAALFAEGFSALKSDSGCSAVLIRTGRQIPAAAATEALCGHQALAMSVCAKSPPLNRSRAPCTLAHAYDKQSAMLRAARLRPLP